MIRKSRHRFSDKIMRKEAGTEHSKLVIPAAKTGTARNINTIATLAKIAAEL